MRDFLKQQYGFSDFQVEVLKYTGKTFASETSKLLIMGIIFHRQLGVYMFAVAVLMLIRTATGGIHCSTYIGCFLVTLAYMVLAIVVLPHIYVNKVFQLILLFLCMLGNYYIGPVTSKVHKPLTEKVMKRVKVQAFLVIFFYLTFVYIVPENPYVTVGFWVIILNTLQLFAGKLLKMRGEKKHERKYESKTCET